MRGRSNVSRSRKHVCYTLHYVQKNNLRMKRDHIRLLSLHRFNKRTTDQSYRVQMSNREFRTNRSGNMESTDNFLRCNRHGNDFQKSYAWSIIF